MDTTLFLLSFTKIFGTFAVLWLVLALLSFIWNKGEGDKRALASATEFAFVVPAFGLMLLLLGIIELPEVPQKSEVPSEAIAGSLAGLVVYLCLSYLAKVRHAADEQ